MCRKACAVERILLTLEQMGARRGRSTETTLETIVEAAHTVWDCDKNSTVSILLLGLTGF